MLFKGLNFVSLRYQVGELALSIAVELMRKIVAIWGAERVQPTYQSLFTKSEYLQKMLRVALPGRPQPQGGYRYLLADS